MDLLEMITLDFLVVSYYFRELLVQHPAVSPIGFPLPEDSECYYWMLWDHVVGYWCQVRLHLDYLVDSWCYSWSRECGMAIVEQSARWSVHLEVSQFPLPPLLTRAGHVRVQLDKALRSSWSKLCVRFHAQQPSLDLSTDLEVPLFLVARSLPIRRENTFWVHPWIF